MKTAKPREYGPQFDRQKGPTVRRPCLRCDKDFDSEGAHNRLCHPCATHNLDPFWK